MEDEFGLTNEDWFAFAAHFADRPYDISVALSAKNSVPEADT